ncbi:MAG TPA: hypothetical protein VGJ41_15985 [Nocardioides sp.]
MNLRTLLRFTSALRFAPLAVGVALFYFFHTTSLGLRQFSLGYPPSVVATSLEVMYPFAYATAIALGAWESGRLREAEIWQLAPARSQYRIAAQVLWPAVGVAWSLLLLPVVLGFAQERSMPTLQSLPPLLMGMLLCVAHSVIGFIVGCRVKRIVAAPVVAAGAWLAVAMSWTVEPFWWRHILGTFEPIEFGERASAIAILADVLPTCGLAVALLLYGVALHRSIGKLGSAVLAILVFASCSGAGFQLARDWGASAPMARAEVPMTCVGHDPEVCVPDISESMLPSIATQVTTSLTRLQSAGVTESPSLVTDSLPDGRSPRASTSQTWYVDLSRGASAGRLATLIIRAAVRFPCHDPEPELARTVLLWAATKAHQVGEVESGFKEDPFFDEAQRNRLHRRVAAVLSQPEQRQAQWYRRSLVVACDQPGSPS